MHEFALTKKLFDSAIKKANSKRIVRVNLLIGPFSEEREDSIRFYWKDLAKGSAGEEAELHFVQILPEMKCLDCTGTFYLDKNNEDSTCRYCDSDHLQLLRGEEVLLESIEIE